MIDFTESARLLWHRRKHVFMFAVTLLGVVWTSMFLSAPRYRATAIVVVSPEGERPWRSGSQDDLFTDAERFRLYETQRKVVRKRVVLDLAAQELASTPYKDVFGLDLVQGLFSASDVKLVPDTEILEVSCEHSDPTASQACANAVAKAYQRFVRVARARSGAQRHEMLQRNAAALQAAWQRASVELAMLEARVGSEADMHADSKHLQRLQALEGRLYLDALGAGQYGKTLERLKTTLGTEAVAHALAGIGVVDDALKRLIVQRQMLVSARVRYGDAHPKLYAAKEAVSAAEKHLEQMISVAFEGLTVDALLLREALRTVGLAVEQQNELTHEAVEERIQVNAAEREVEKAERLSSVVEEQMIVTSLETMMPTLVVHLVDEAVKPTKVIAPKPLQNSLSAVLFGLLGGVVLVLVAEWVNPRVRSSNAIESALGFAPLAHLSMASLSGKDPPPVVTLLSQSAGTVGLYPVDALPFTVQATDNLAAHGVSAGFQIVSNSEGHAANLVKASKFSVVVLVASVNQTSHQKVVQMVVEVTQATGERPSIILVH